ncbi:MAG: DUF3667 domain-containing protein [Bacteroidota bacterium]
MVVHFFNDITHFDGKLFSSLKWLIAKPGFLSTEYLAGRRARYLHPIRMYVFTSAIFFIIFFSLFNADQLNMNNWTESEKLEKTVTDFSAEAYKNAKTKEDTLSVTRALALIEPVMTDKSDTTGKKPKVGIGFGSIFQFIIIPLFLNAICIRNIYREVIKGTGSTYLPDEFSTAGCLLLYLNDRGYDENYQSSFMDFGPGTTL